MAASRIFPDHCLSVKECNTRSLQKKRGLRHCIWCNKPNDLFPKLLCSKCELKRRERGQQYRLQLKRDTFNAYGGAICACPYCRVTILGFLTLDHIEGNDWRKYKHRAGDKLYSELRKLRYPPGFQVLCFNCNIARFNNGGICPHNEGF